MGKILSIIFIILLFVPISLACQSVGTVVEKPQDCCSGFGIFHDSKQLLFRCISSTSSFITEDLNLATSVNKSATRRVEPITEISIDIQYATATTHSPFTTLDMEFDLKKDKIAEASSLIGSYIVAYLMLMLEFLKILFYVFEMRLLVYVFLTLLPAIFFKVRDGMVQSMLRSKES